ncbi:MAG: ferrochelatase [Chloroflexota bacterium]
MAYREPASLDPHTSSDIGILLVNVGSPAAPTGAALRPYLAQFLGDERIIEYPRWMWQPILHGIILNTRPRRSARLYERVWTEEGSPLLSVLHQQAAALEAWLGTRLPVPVKVEAGMRYGDPSIAHALRELDRANVRRILVFPLYPQYSATTTATSLDAVFDELKTWRRMPELRTINRYHTHPLYIKVLATAVQEQWTHTGRPERLLMSFHGIPQEYADKGDPYYHECHETAQLLVEELRLDADEWQVTFQSRFGPAEWLQPYTDVTLTEWGQAGLAHVDAICPGFSADCLETVDEVGREGRESFQEAGGGEFHYIPALNARPNHIEALGAVALEHLGGWVEPGPENMTADNIIESDHRQMIG